MKLEISGSSSVGVQGQGREGRWRMGYIWEDGEGALGNDLIRTSGGWFFGNAGAHALNAMR